MMAKLRDRIAARKSDERGVTLLEAVIAMALFFAIGGSFIYASTVVYGARNQSIKESTSTISQTGISNSFRTDMSNAKGTKLVSANNLLIARSDGSCVSWTISQPSSGSPKVLLRGSAQGAAVAAGSSRELASGISAGALSLGPSGAALNLTYSNGSKFSESAPLELSGSDGGVCW